MITIENLSVSSKHHTKACILGFILILLIITPVFSYTTEVTVRRYATDGLTPINDTTVDYHWMEENLPVYGDGITHYYSQGPTFNASDYWDDAEWQNIESRDMGEVIGTDLKDLCNLIGGGSSGKPIRVIGSDNVGRDFGYESIYYPNPRQGPMIVTWKKDGMYPEYGYDEGMRLVMFADAKENTFGWNTSGWHVFGNADMRDCWSSQYWYNYSGIWPSSGGTSIYKIRYINVVTSDPVPPPIADFSANIRTWQILNGNFETKLLTPWTGSGATIYTGLSPGYRLGNASVRLVAPTSNTAMIYQDIDLTSMTTISFYRYMLGKDGKYLQVLVDGTQVANYTEPSTIKGNETVDISSYGFSGIHTIKFNAVNTLTTEAFTVYLDNIEDYGAGTTGDAPHTVLFKDLSTKMDDTTNTSRLWDFYNNGTATSTEKNPKYIYTENGTYSVKLTVTNAGGSDSEIKTDYITVGTMPPTIDIDTTGGIADWPFATGTNENTTSVNLSVTTTASSWHVAVKDALDGGKPPGSVGRMAEYTGSAYVDPGGKVLANALQVNCSGGSYVSLSGSDQNIKTGTSSGTFEYDIGLKQEIASGDPALASPNVYRILVTFTGATD